MTRGDAFGFTLLEVLLASTISLLLSGLLLMFTAAALDLWQRSRADIASAGQAMQALDLLTADLQGAVIRRDGVNWLACDVTDSVSELARRGWDTAMIAKSASVGAVPIDGIATTAFGLSGAWLRFVTTKPDTHADARRSSAPVVVSYQIIRRGGSAPARYEFCRSVVRTASSSGGLPGTFETGYDVASGAYDIPSSVPGNPGNVVSPASIDVLATDVVDFGVVVYSRGADGELVRDFPRDASDRSYRITEAAGPPFAVDVMLRTLTPEGAQRLADVETGRSSRPATISADEWWRSLVASHSTVHVRRIAIVGSP